VRFHALLFRWRSLRCQRRFARGCAPAQARLAPAARQIPRNLKLNPRADSGTTASPTSRRDKILKKSGSLCGAACIWNNNSFTMNPHPDVGEGSRPATGSTGAGFFDERFTARIG